MRKIFIAMLLLPFCAQSQLLDSIQLETAYVYTSMEEALKEPYKVYRLHLRKQKLDSIPAEVFSLPNLQELDVSKNKISALPDNIGELQRLQILNISGNNIEQLPHSIGDLKELKKLFANKNKLASLPARIGDLSNLRMMDLWSNEISYFPEDLSKLKSLRKLDLRNILINDATQNKLREWLPNTKIFMDPDCKCAGG